MYRRGTYLLISILLLACDSTTGPGLDDWRFDPSPQQSLVSSDVVKTVLMQDGTLYSWGDGYSGTLGQGNFKDQRFPAKVPGLEHVISYDQSSGMAFALTDDGTLYQWGHYMFSSVYPHATPQPTKAGSVAGAVSVFAEGWDLYILDKMGALWELSPSHVHPSKTSVPQRVNKPKRVSQVSGRVGLYEDGTLFPLAASDPEDGGPVEGLNGITAIFNSYRHSVVLKEDGTYCSQK